MARSLKQSMMVVKGIKRLFWVGFLMVVVALFAVTIAGVQEEDQRVDYVVVLGNKVELNGTPSARLAARLDQAYVLWDEGRCEKVIVSGGTGVEGFDESKVMHDYLIQKGIPVTALLMDPAGNTTRKTAENMESLVTDPEKVSVCAVSQFFHTPRCRLALRQAGFSEVSSSYARYVELRDLYATLREIPALLKYRFFS